MEEPGAWRVPFPLVYLRASLFCDAVRSFEHRCPLLILAIDRHNHRLYRCKLRRKHQPFIVRMAHDQATDEARAHAPTGLPDVIELTRLALEADVEGASEVLTQVVAGSGLQSEAVLHHGLDGIAVQRAGELLALRLQALDHWHRHHLFGDLGVDVEHA